MQKRQIPFGTSHYFFLRERFEQSNATVRWTVARDGLTERNLYFRQRRKCKRISTLGPRGNHNHRPCRWFAQAPLGPFTSRAYRLIEYLSLACLAPLPQMRLCTHRTPAPSDEGAGFCKAKDWGRDLSLLVSLPPSSPNGESTSLIRGRLDRCGGTGHS